MNLAENEERALKELRNSGDTLLIFNPPCIMVWISGLGD